MYTIDEARAELRKNWETGLNCPCCGQRVQLYKVVLTSAQTTGLVNLYRMDKKQPNQYFKISDIEAYKEGFSGGSFAKCKHWGLAVDQVNTDTHKRTSGMWAITDLGRRFVEGKVTVPKYVQLYNKKKYGDPTHEAVHIQDTFKSRFDYHKLMGNDLYNNDPEQERLV